MSSVNQLLRKISLTKMVIIVAQELIVWERIAMITIPKFILINLVHKTEQLAAVILFALLLEQLLLKNFEPITWTMIVIL